MGGHIDGIPACRWWRAFLAFVWNTSERRGAALAVRCDWIDWDRGIVQIPPQVRKGRKKSACYALWPETLLLMQQIRLPERELFWPWIGCEGTYWYQYGKLLKMAGIPNDRKHKTHSLRVSHNTWTKAMTGRHSPLLQHGSQATSERHYEDKKFTQEPPPRLFIPWENRS
jgi:integrase